MATKPAATPDPKPAAAAAGAPPVHPAEGGSYVRNPDGSLTRVIDPTTVPEFNPQPTE